jgi:hypothetical protein
MPDKRATQYLMCVLSRVYELPRCLNVGQPDWLAVRFSLLIAIRFTHKIRFSCHQIDGRKKNSGGLMELRPESCAGSRSEMLALDLLYFTKVL